MSKPINENDWFNSLDEFMANLADGERVFVVFCDRVSYETQRDNLYARKPFLVDMLQRKYGDRLVIIEIFTEVADGRSDMLNDRVGLGLAVRYAKKHGLILLVPSVDRLVRTIEHDQDNQFLPLLMDDIVPLIRLLQGVPVLTIIPPGTCPKKVRSIYGKWGQEATGNKGGRPPTKSPGYKKDRRNRLRPIVIWLYLNGLSLRMISKEIKNRYKDFIHHTTIWTWIQRKN